MSKYGVSSSGEIIAGIFIKSGERMFRVYQGGESEVQYDQNLEALDNQWAQFRKAQSMSEEQRKAFWKSREVKESMIYMREVLWQEMKRYC